MIYIEPEISMTQSQLDAREKELFKSFLLRLIHCTDGARYEEDMVDDYWGLICDMKREYQAKYGEEVE
jgi:hypothetical protein